MVILAAAAITAAGVGAYKGGKAAAEDIGKKVRRHTTQKLRKEERKLETSERDKAQEKESIRTENMSAKERVERFKKSVPGGTKPKKSLFRNKN